MQNKIKGKHPKMFKFRSLVISNQFLKGHISQILEFLPCVLMDFFQDVYTEYFSEAISKWSNYASFTCISEGWVLKREAKNICINLVHTLCEPDVWHNFHFFLFRFDEWKGLLRSLNIHIFAFPISLSVGEVSSIVSQ